MGGIGNAFAANFADAALNGFDRMRASAAHRESRNIGERFAADAAIRGKDCVEHAGES